MSFFSNLYFLFYIEHALLAYYDRSSTAGHTSGPRYSEEAIHSPARRCQGICQLDRGLGSRTPPLRLGLRQRSLRGAGPSPPDAWPYLVVEDRLRVAAFVVALHRQPRELHGVPLQRLRVHGAQAPRRRRQTSPDAGPRRPQTSRAERRS